MTRKGLSRNAPCPCGSGKKYKQCCMEKQAEEDSLWRRLHETDQQLTNALFQYIFSRFDQDIILEAWDDFVLGREEDLFEFDPESHQNQAFIPWLFSNWRPEAYLDEPTFRPSDRPAVFPIARAYLQSNRHMLSSVARAFLEETCARPFSFYEVVHIQPGHGFTLRDILREREVFVWERSGSKSAREADILFGKVIEYKDIAIMAGTGGVAIPPRYKFNVLELRKAMRSAEGTITEQTLHTWADEIRDLYLSLYATLHRPPRVTNTDGHAILFHELTFKIPSPEVAYARLKSLHPDLTEDRLPPDAEFHPDGTLKRVEFAHVREEDNTVLGHLTIDGDELQVSVNSKERALNIREEIEKRLGDQVSYVRTKVTELGLGEIRESRESAEPEEESPEAEAIVRQSLEEHWRKWVHVEIPALGGITPAEAAEDPDGREALIALLKDFERSDREEKGRGRVSQLPYIQRVRKELGLE